MSLLNKVSRVLNSMFSSIKQKLSKAANVQEVSTSLKDFIATLDFTSEICVMCPNNSYYYADSEFNDGPRTHPSIKKAIETVQRTLKDLNSRQFTARTDEDKDVLEALRVCDASNSVLCSAIDRAVNYDVWRGKVLHYVKPVGKNAKLINSCHLSYYHIRKTMSGNGLISLVYEMRTVTVKYGKATVSPGSVRGSLIIDNLSRVSSDEARCNSVRMHQILARGREMEHSIDEKRFYSQQERNDEPEL